MALEDVATKDGYDVQIQTNHLSHFLLVKELFPLLEKAGDLKGEARIVHHTSAARSSPSSVLKAEYFEAKGGDLGGNGSSMLFGGARWVRYQQSKLANSVFTKALADRLEGTKIKATVAAPGLASTDLQSTAGKNGGLVGVSVFAFFSQSAEDDTMPILAASFDPSSESGDMWEPANRFNMAGPAVKVQWDKLSMDEESRQLLWEKSEEARGKFDIPSAK